MSERKTFESGGNLQDFSSLVCFSLNFFLTIAVMVRGHSSDILLVPHWTLIVLFILVCLSEVVCT